jgi:flagellar biosynthesis protein FliP
MKTLISLILLILPSLALAEPISFDFGDSGTFTARIFQMIALISVVSIAPSIIITVTSFTRIIVVLSLLRSALGLQQTPPNPVIISLALFLTAFIMTPTFETAYNEGIAPLIEEKISTEESWSKTVKPFHKFMISHTRDKDLLMFLNAGHFSVDIKPENVPLQALIPAFMIGELKRAFEIGFLVFLPFLVIDMLVSSILMAMGMMMLPPVMISLPFKLIFFVAIDGWHMISGSLIRSFGV